MIKCDDVKYINVPYFDGLAIEDMLEWARGHNNGEALEALPVTEKETLKLPREYLANVIYTICGNPFQTWVNQRITARNAKVTTDRDLAIHMDPEIARLFQQSTSVSRKCPVSLHSPF